jgi:Flp pilus assembly protein TadG
MPSPAASTASVRTILRRFRRNRGGSAAVEFALVAPVFFALLFAIIETALVFFASQVLETVTQNSARMILTGQANAAGYATASDLKSKAICLTGSVANDTNGNFITGNLQYCPGNGGAIVVVRLFYQWPLFVTGLGYNIASLTGSKRLLYGTAAFRNEPFTANPAPC